uniref:Uncharacterized protein n=1 Tax=Sphaerodactylus townsendi TaxID=933632 RepID=A0ACB8F697_9SAUR
MAKTEQVLSLEPQHELKFRGLASPGGTLTIPGRILPLEGQTSPKTLLGLGAVGVVTFGRFGVEGGTLELARRCLIRPCVSV